MVVIMDKVIERIDAHGKIIWLPPLRVDVAVSIAAELGGIIAGAPDWDRAAELIDMRGGMLVLSVEHHGPQDYRAWTIHAKTGGWLAARIEALEA